MLDDSLRVIVDIKGVAKHSGERDARVGALRTLDLTAHAGGMVAPPGSSGSGKTALLNIIGCIIDPSDGQDNLDSEMINDNRWLRGDLRCPRLDQVGFIVQAHNLLPFRNATDNVALVLQFAGKTATEVQTRALDNSPRNFLAEEPTAVLNSKRRDRDGPAAQTRLQTGHVHHCGDA